MRHGVSPGKKKKVKAATPEELKLISVAAQHGKPLSCSHRFSVDLDILSPQLATSMTQGCTHL